MRSAALVAGMLALALAVGASAAGAVRDRTATPPGTTPPSVAPTSAVIPASQGSVRWRFQVSGQYVLHRPAVGPDGGVVVASSSGDVYSLTADGALRWTVPSIGSDGGPSIGADGTVYVASLSTITAIAPDGSIKWSYTEPSAGQGVIAGPTVGPDGNVYVISDVGGLGAFALSPAGDLLWSNPGNPTYIEYGQIGAELVFGSGRLYAAFDQGLAGPSTMFGLSLGGTQEWARTIGGTDDPFMQQQRQPATGADGSLYLTAFNSRVGWGLLRVDADTGDILWDYFPSPANGMSPPSVAPDGSVYFSRSLSFLESVTSTGESRWIYSDGSIIDHPAVSPDGSIVVAGDHRISACLARSAAGTPRTGRSHGSTSCPMRTAGTRSSSRSRASRQTAPRPTSALRSSEAGTSTHSSTRSTPAFRHRHLHLRHHRRLHLRHRRRRHRHLLHHHRHLLHHHHPSSSSSSSSSTTTTTSTTRRPLRRPESGRIAARRCEKAYPGTKMCARSRSPCPFQAGRPRDRPEPETRRHQALRLPGPAHCRSPVAGARSARLRPVHVSFSLWHSRNRFSHGPDGDRLRSPDPSKKQRRIR